jgi:two-component system chemotaxis response regulator CheB
VSALPESPAPVTVVVVDDSPTQRRFVHAAVASDPTIEIVGEARDGRDGVALVERLRPAAVLMDLHLPVMNGIEAIERIMAGRPTPIVVYSSFVDGMDRANAVSALAAGAIDVLAKPEPDDFGRLESYAAELRARLRVAGRVTVITHPRGRLGASASTLSTRRLRTAGGPAGGAAVVAGRDEPLDVSGVPRRRAELVVIGASTGGPQALARLLAELPATATAAFVVVQHMADGFMEGLASWLDTMSPLPVGVGTGGKRLTPGTVTLAPSGLNLVVHPRLRVSAHEPPAGQYHVPGIDVTFTSAAEAYGADAVGLILTGMGRDGALGLNRIRECGGFTIAQDQASSAVYGMPAAAMSLGAVDVQLPLDAIAPAIRRLVGVRQAGS